MTKISYGVLAILTILTVFNNSVFGQAKIKVYFSTPVNNSVSTGVNAVYLPSGSMADTIVAYINRAKHSIDIAQYDYNQSSNYGAFANIITAVNNAYNRGVTVRWIYDGSSSNTALSSLNSGIYKVGSPTASGYGIMHDKFVIIDANDGNPDDAILSTGSEDWSSEMFYKDYNNILFIQDSALAAAYTAEFNMMWGSTTAVPNAGAAKFGPDKTNLGLHNFTIAGHHVELYFSPSDNTDNHVGSTILTANTDLYVGVYDITRTSDANDIVNMKNAGVYTLALVDQFTPSSSSSVNNILSSGLGSDYVVYSGSYLYHNKMMVVDPSDTCSDPIVLTGSYNWTTSGTQYNDENILIIHSDTIANIYYQSFVQNFATISGRSVNPVAGCGAASVQTVNGLGNDLNIYPNPATSDLAISMKEPITSVTISNMIGQVLFSSICNATQAHINVSGLTAGVYLIKINNNITRKFVKE